MEIICCPCCHAPDVTELGTLGKTVHYRCRHCGWDFPASEAEIRHTSDVDDCDCTHDWSGA